MPFPQRIELPQNCIDQRRSRGPDSQLKIPSPTRFGAEARAGEIGAAHIHTIRIEDDRLEMQPRASTDHQILGQRLLEFPQRGGAGGARMEQSDFDALSRQAPENFDN